MVVYCKCGVDVRGMLYAARVVSRSWPASYCVGGRGVTASSMMSRDGKVKNICISLTVNILIGWINYTLSIKIKSFFTCINCTYIFYITQTQCARSRYIYMRCFQPAILPFVRHPFAIYCPHKGGETPNSCSREQLRALIANTHPRHEHSINAYCC